MKLDALGRRDRHLVGRTLLSAVFTPDADLPLLHSDPSLPDVVLEASHDYPVPEDFRQLHRRSDGGYSGLFSELGSVISACLHSRVAVFTLTSSALGLGIAFPLWTWRYVFFNADSLLLKAKLTLRSPADRKLLRRLIASPDFSLTYYGVEEGTNKVVIASRHDFPRFALGDGRVVMDFNSCSFLSADLHVIPARKEGGDNA